MKKLVIISILIFVLFTACQSIAAEDGGIASIPINKASFFSAAISPESLDSPEDFISAIEDNEYYFLQWDNTKRDNPEWVAVYSRQNDYYRVRKVKLIGDFSRRFPDAPELEDLLLDRFDLYESVWQLDIISEVKEYEQEYKGSPAKVEKAWYYYYDGIISRNYRKEEPILQTLTDFDRKYPDSELAEALYERALSYLRDTPSYEKVQKLLIEKFPEGNIAKSLMSEEQRRNLLKKMEGREFKLSFTDRISGNKINTEDLKGQVLVIDFWATWCGPCVSELPEMKKIYAEYKLRGVEFIGISLDSEISTLKAFCLENNISWPQYCEAGKTWETSVSQKWNIQAVPTIFIVDKQGKVYSADARGRIPRLLDELL